MDYLNRIPISKQKRKFAKDIILFEERIFWTIDDTVDHGYSFSSDARLLEYYNEVSKFFTFVELMSTILNNQMSNKADFLQVIIGKPTTAERILDAILDNILDLIKIPYNEVEIEKKILKEIDERDLQKLLMENQLNRAQNIKIYLGTIEAITKKKIPQKPFLTLRAIQLIREDLNDFSADKKRHTNNLLGILLKKYGKNSIAKKELNNVISLLRQDLDEQVDDSLNYLKKIADSEEQNIHSLLSSKSANYGSKVTLA